MYEQFEGLIRAALLFAAIFALTAIAMAVARRMRRRQGDATRDASDIMANFRDVYERGGLSDEEFRTIKAKLASDIKNQGVDSKTTDSKITDSKVKDSGGAN
jgi:hypothetical protein